MEERQKEEVKKMVFKVGSERIEVEVADVVEFKAKVAEIQQSRGLDKLNLYDQNNVKISTRLTNEDLMSIDEVTFSSKIIPARKE